MKEGRLDNLMILFRVLILLSIFGCIIAAVFYAVHFGIGYLFKISLLKATLADYIKIAIGGVIGLLSFMCLVWNREMEEEGSKDYQHTKIFVFALAIIFLITKQYLLLVSAVAGPLIYIGFIELLELKESYQNSKRSGGQP